MNREERAAAHGKHMSSVSLYRDAYTDGKKGWKGADWREKDGGRDVRQGRVDPLRGTASPVDADEEKGNLKSNGTE